MISFIKRQSARIGATVTLLFAVLVLGVRHAHAQYQYGATQPASGVITSTMDPGDSGGNVTALQIFLAKDPAIYPEGSVTGFYGAPTMVAVQRFQCRHEIICEGDVASTGYGRVGPVTLRVIQSLQGSVSLPLPFTRADVFAPVMSTATITVASTSATFHWTTNEPAMSAVLYGSAWPFYIGTAPSAWDRTTMDLSANVVVTGLTPNTTYHYVLQSLDASGNVQWDVGRSFTTLR